MAKPESQARSPPPRTLALQAHSRRRLGKTIATRNQFCVSLVMICMPSTSRRLEGAWRRKHGAEEGI